ncbi:MAG: hypothetical protein AAGC44_05325 [Planctomycetota bacterium]
MSANPQRLPLPVAEGLAAKIRRRLEPGCERIEAAGSLRRRCPSVGDLEFVVIPRGGDDRDLFGNAASGRTALDLILDQLRAERRLLPLVNGPKQKRFELTAFAGLTLELYLVQPEAWGVQLMIRTGPAEFSHRMVTHRRARGLMPDTHRIYQGRLYRTAYAHAPHAVPINDRRYELIPTPEESDLFEAMGLPDIPPRQRQRLADWRVPVAAAARPQIPASEGPVG